MVDRQLRKRVIRAAKGSAVLERGGEAAFDYDLHGGTDLTRIQWYFVDRSRLPVALQLWELPPAGSEGMHSHPAEDPLEELYLVVEGHAAMTVDGETHELDPGDAVLAPAGSEHDLRNTGTTPLKVVVVWGRPSEPVDPSRYGTGRAARAAVASREDDVSRASTRARSSGR